MNQELIQIIDDIIKIGLFFYKGRAGANYYRILNKHYKEVLVNCFRYYLKGKGYSGQLFDVELSNTDGYKQVKLIIHNDQAPDKDLTGLEVDLSDLNINVQI